MWGTAIYFSENANFADRYAFVKTKKKIKKKTVIIAKVLLGESILMDSDQNLKRPPFKKEKEKEMYDSVQGMIQGSSVFMVYDNNRAYPAYLITYS